MPTKVSLQLSPAQQGWAQAQGGLSLPLAGADLPQPLKSPSAKQGQASHSTSPHLLLIPGF